MMKSWYFANKDQPIGPFTLADAKDLMERARGWEELMVWRAGFSQWQTAGSVPELMALFESPPPITFVSSSACPKPQHGMMRGLTAARLGLGIALLAAFATGGAFGHMLVPGGVSSSTAPSPITTFDLENELSKAAIKMRTDLPKKIDAATIITGVWSEGTTLIFENLILGDPGKFDDPTKERLRQSVVRNVCGGAASRGILEIGGSFRYRFADSDARPVMAVDVERRACP